MIGKIRKIIAKKSEILKIKRLFILRVIQRNIDLIDKKQIFS